MDKFNFTYLYANGYLDKFRGFFNNPGLSYQGLTAILKTFYKYKGWRMYKDDENKHTIWYKGDLDKILDNRNFYLPQFKQVCFNKWDKNRINKEWQNEPPIDYSSDAEDMEKVSQGLINQDNYGYGQVDESLRKMLMEMYGEPEYGKIINIYYKPTKNEDGEPVYFIKQFYTLDNGYYTNFDTEYDENDLIYYFGEKVANDIINCEGEHDDRIMQGGIFLNYDKEPEIDIANVSQVNAYALEQYGTTNNFKHAGYLLTTGELLDFAGGASPLDPRGVDHHNLNINGLDLYGFIALGNIRITPENPGFEFCKTPTRQQIQVINAFIRQYGYKAGYFIVDRVDEEGNNVWNKEYEMKEFQNIIPDITSNSNPNQRYTSQFKDFLQEKKMSKKVYITEAQLKEIIKESQQFPVEPEKVRIVKNYLDDNFIKGGISCLGENGYPTTTPIVALKGTDGNPAKNMTDKQLFALLLDKFKNIYGDESKKKRFLQQVIKDWYYNKISKENLLTKNSF